MIVELVPSIGRGHCEFRNGRSLATCPGAFHSPSLFLSFVLPCRRGSSCFVEFHGVVSMYWSPSFFLFLSLFLFFPSFSPLYLSFFLLFPFLSSFSMSSLHSSLSSLFALSPFGRLLSSCTEIRNSTNGKTKMRARIATTKSFNRFKTLIITSHSWQIPSSCNPSSSPSSNLELYLA